MSFATIFPQVDRDFLSGIKSTLRETLKDIYEEPKPEVTKDQIDGLNKALNMLGRTNTVKYDGYTGSQLIKLQQQYEGTKIEVFSLVGRSNCFYMSLQIDRVVLFSHYYNEG